MANSAKEPANSLRRSMVLGSIWMIAMRWAMRLIGIVSTMILARILVPEDFGLVAMCMLVFGFVQVLTGFGVDLALIQRQDLERAHYDTAWTIRLLQLVIVGVAVIAVSPWVVDYYNDPKVQPLLWVLSLSVFCTAFENIGVVAFRKELDFSREFQFKVYAKIGSFFVTIGLAFWLRSYWALAIGIVSHTLFSTLISYAMHPYRPRFSLAKRTDIWSFSQWILVRNIGMYIRKKLDQLLIGRQMGQAQLGYYSIANELAELPTTEVIWPMARALFPGYAKMANDRPRLGAAYLKVLNTLATIAMPAAAGVYLLADPLVQIILGEKWLPVIEPMAVLALYSMVLTLGASVQPVLMALNYMKLLVSLVWVQLLVAVPFMWWAVQQGDLVLVAEMQLYSALILLPLFFLSLIWAGVVKPLQVLSALWRPAMATTVMVAVLWQLPELPMTWVPAWAYPLLELMMTSTIGAAVFAPMLLLCWWLAKRPDGGERLLLGAVASKVPLLNKLL